MKNIKNISEIKNITSIEQLAKYDAIIREYAPITLKIRDKNIIDDLIQEMYINVYKYLNKYPNKVIDGGFVVVSLKNLHRNYLAYEVNRYDRGGADYEPTFPELPDEFEEIYQEKQQTEQLYDELENRINKLTWYEKKILEYSQEMSLSELSRKSKISYLSLIYSKNKINEKLGITKKEK